MEKQELEKLAKMIKQKTGLDLKLIGSDQRLHIHYHERLILQRPYLIADSSGIGRDSDDRGSDSSGGNRVHGVSQAVPAVLRQSTRRPACARLLPRPA